MAKNFKPGQKVVYNPYCANVNALYGNLPENNSIVTIHGKCAVYDAAWEVVEFLYDKNGHVQCIHESFLFELKKSKNPDLYIKLEPKKVLEEQLIIQN